MQNLNLNFERLTKEEKKYYIEKAQWYHDNNLFDSVSKVVLADTLYKINLEVCEEVSGKIKRYNGSYTIE